MGELWGLGGVMNLACWTIDYREIYCPMTHAWISGPPNSPFWARTTLPSVVFFAGSAGSKKANLENLTKFPGNDWLFRKLPGSFRKNRSPGIQTWQKSGGIWSYHHVKSSSNLGCFVGSASFGAWCFFLFFVFSFNERRYMFRCWKNTAVSHNFHRISERWSIVVCEHFCFSVCLLTLQVWLGGSYQHYSLWVWLHPVISPVHQKTSSTNQVKVLLASLDSVVLSNLNTFRFPLNLGFSWSNLTTAHIFFKWLVFLEVWIDIYL